MNYTKANGERERWKSKLERLEEDCSEERKAAKENVSRLSDRVEQAEASARRAMSAVEEEQAALRASLAAEYNQACSGRLGKGVPRMSTKCSGRKDFGGAIL